MSMMAWIGSGNNCCGLGWMQKNWAGLGFEKAFHVNSGLSAQAVELLRSELALGHRLNVMTLIYCTLLFQRRQC